MSYQFASIQDIEPLQIFLDLPDNVLPQNSGLKFQFLFISTFQLKAIYLSEWVGQLGILNMKT